MGIFDDIKNAVAEHEAELESAIDKAADFIDEKTGGQFAGHLDQAQEFLKDNIGDEHEPEAPAVVTDEVVAEEPVVVVEEDERI